MRALSTVGVKSTCNCELVTLLVKTSDIGLFIPPAAA